MKDTLTFDQLPQAVSQIQDKLDNIERILLQQHEQPTGQEELMPIIQAAKFLDLAVPTLYSKVCRKEIPVNKRGKRLYFYRSELTDGLNLAEKRRPMKSVVKR